MTENLPAIIESKGMAPYRAPAMVLAEALVAATFLKKMISDTKSSMKIGQSEHIKFEAWQTVGTFFNVSVDTSQVEPCSVDGTDGAKCAAKIIDNATGNVIGGGVAYCMRDEKNWASKPWFQLSSMAQTRAASKALANKFRWISVMAGYAPTPAEEMDGHEEPRTVEQEPQEPTVTWDVAKDIKAIQDMLGMICGGDETLMNEVLKDLTKWNDKETKAEKFVQIADLPGIGKHKPAWLKTIHKKVVEKYEKRRA